MRTPSRLHRLHVRVRDLVFAALLVVIRAAPGVTRLASRLGITLDLIALREDPAEDVIEVLPRGPEIRTRPEVDGYEPEAARSSGDLYPSVGCAVLHDALVLADANGVVASGRAHRRIPVDQSDYGWSGSSVPMLRAVRGDVGLIAWRHAARPRGAGILLTGTAATSWYHWVVEILPRLWVSRLLPAELRGLPLIVSEASLAVAPIRATIEALAPSNEIIAIRPGVPQRFEMLVLPDGITRTDEGAGRRVEAPGSRAFHAAAARRYRADLMAALGAEDRDPVNPVRLFVARPHAYHRRAYNQNEVFEPLSRMGFVAIDPGQMGAREQAELFRSAGVIAGTTGAAMTNLLFTGPAARAAITVFREYVGLGSIWSNLAGIAGGRVRLVPLDVEPPRDRTLSALASYSIDPSLLPAALDRAGWV